MPSEVINPPEIVTPAAIQNIPAHPRLLADAARWTELRELIKTSPTHRELYAFLRRSADALLQKPPVDYTPKRPGENILAIIRDAEDRIFTLAMMYRLSGDKAYLGGALDVMRGLAATPWPEGHFLDPATACGSLAVGYDWLFDELTPAERDTFASKIKTAGLELTTHDQEHLSFLWADFNWNQICNTGLTLGALAIADREPDLARYIVNRTLAMIPRVAAAYAPDGVYPEGPGYWAYGTSYQVMLIEALRSSLHTSHDLEKSPGFLESASVIDQVTGPSGGYFNTFDTRPGRTNQNLVYWFARETRHPELAAKELARLRQAIADGAPKSSVGLAFALLWFPPAPTPATADTARTAAPLHWQGGGHQPLAILRSTWHDPAATWFAIKGGTADYSHGHMDAGSFVLEAGGVRWALDPEIEDYLDVRSRTGLTHGQFFSYAQDSQRWAHFRLGPEGHNILRFDGARQNVSGHATIAPLVESADGSATVEVNLDSTYAGQASRVRCTATLRPDASVVLADTWTTLDKPADVAWQFLTRATVTREPSGLRLDQDGRTLRLRIEADQSRIDIQDVTTLLDPKFDGTLPGFTRIVIRVPTPANTVGVLTVTFSLENAAH
jgi:hypothetical protein